MDNWFIILYATNILHHSVKYLTLQSEKSFLILGVFQLTVFFLIELCKHFTSSVIYSYIALPFPLTLNNQKCLNFLCINLPKVSNVFQLIIIEYLRNFLIVD